MKSNSELMLKAIKKDPFEITTRLAYIDSLEEDGNIEELNIQKEIVEKELKAKELKQTILQKTKNLFPDCVLTPLEIKFAKGFMGKFARQYIDNGLIFIYHDNSLQSCKFKYPQIIGIFNRIEWEMRCDWMCNLIKDNIMFYRKSGGSARNPRRAGIFIIDRKKFLRGEID